MGGPEGGRRPAWAAGPPDRRGELLIGGIAFVAYLLTALWAHEISLPGPVLIWFPPAGVAIAATYFGARASMSVGRDIRRDTRAFVGADGDGPRDLGQRVVGACGQRLLDKLDAGGGCRLHEIAQHGLGPRLVGIDDDARVRTSPSNRRHPGRIAVAAELQLQERQVCDVPRASRHVLGRGEAERIGRRDRMRCWKAGASVDWCAGRLGLEIP